MAFLKAENCKISGICAAVPKDIEENKNYGLFDKKQYDDFVASVGIERKRFTEPESSLCSSNLSVAACEKLICELSWNKDDISFLVFVSQSPDYRIPITATIIQDKLGLKRTCYAIDSSLGCSGWTYGLSVITALLEKSVDPIEKRKGLLVTGDLATKYRSWQDKSYFPLFGDAFTATAVEYKEKSEPMLFNMNSDGSGFDAIIIRDFGTVNLVGAKSLEMQNYGEGIVHNRMQLELNGMDVFSFGITEVPKNVNKLIEFFEIDKEKIDYFSFHQANLQMNETIRKKLKLPEEKVPYSLKDFGNTSSASIPITLATQLRNKLKTKKLNHISCGFGVGLSWGSVAFSTDNICVPELVEI